MQTIPLAHSPLLPLPNPSPPPAVPRALFPDLCLPALLHPPPSSPSLPRVPAPRSPASYPFLASRPTSPRPRPISPSQPASSPSVRPMPLFPPPHSAPHHLTHFPPLETSYPPNMDRYSIANRYLRANDKYSLNQHPLLDQRRMSEPSVYGTAASGFPSNAADLSDARYRQLHHQFSYAPSPSYPPHPSPRSPSSRPLPDPAWKDHRDTLDIDEPLSPLNPTFSGGASSPPMGMSGVIFGSLHEDYGPSPPGTGTSTSSTPATHHHSNHPGSSSPSNTKQYSFVSLPGNGVKKRPRRRYDEIERLYQCSWQNCTKAYGTLNHLNAHITMQKHGPKRSPNEFKELRKQWRKAKKEEAEARALDAVRYGSHPHPLSAHHHPSRHPPSDVDYQPHNMRPPFDYPPHPERSVPHIASLDDLHDHHPRDDYPRRSQRYGPFVSSHPHHSGMAYGHPQTHGPNTANVPADRLPANSTLLTPLPGYEQSSIGGGSDFGSYSSYDLYRSDNRSRTASHASPGRHGDRGRSRSSHDWPQS